jgi:acyl-CoA dehydrogenase
VLHDVSARALQLHGSLGASNEMPFSKYLVESFHMGLADGPTEVHKVTLAREVLSGFSTAGDLFPTRHIPKLRAAARAQFADLLEEMEGDMAE